MAGRLCLFDVFGNVVKLPPADFLTPVQCCYCSEIYDLAATTRIARYSDCDVFRTPCCGRRADTRNWTGSPSYVKLYE